ncbi:MAG: SulA-like leucine-rich domain-containing protein [Venatoribacter sp.]
MMQLSLSMSEPIFTAADDIIAIERGSLTEIILSDDSAIQPMQLLPLLAQCSAEQRWLMWLSQERVLNKAWIESMGLKNSAIIYLESNATTQTKLCSQLLKAGNSHLVVDWQGKLDSETRRLIREQAIESGSHVILIQHAA